MYKIGFEEKSDNTRVARPMIYEPIKQVPLLEQATKHRVINQPVLRQDIRTKEQKEEDHKQGKAQEYVDNQKKLRSQTGQLMGIGAGLVGLGLIQGTPIGPYVNTALATHSGYNLARQADKGTLGVNLETGLNTIGLLPGGVNLFNKTYPYAKALAEQLAYDKYTTLGGRFGYYGNWVDRIKHTIGRNINHNMSPKHPELLRKIDQLPKINQNKTIQISRPTPREDFERTNFTTDRPVVSHNMGDWDSDDLLIIDPAVTKGLKPESIEPSDMFFVNTNITAKPNQVTFISGSPSRLIVARDQGMSTLSSKKLREIRQKMDDAYYSELRRIKDLTGLQKRLQKTRYKDIVPLHLRQDYAKEIQRLQSKRGTPTIEDYDYLEKLYGLDAGIIGISELNPKRIEAIFKPGMIIRYPNGRELDQNYFYPRINSEKHLLEKAPYNKVFYDPASTVESDWAIQHGINQ